MRHFLLLLLCCCQLALAAGTDRGLDTNAPVPRPPLEEKRVALVIGNANYRTWAPLANPVNDARAMGDTLRRHGFRVITAENATREAMRDALRRFGNELTDGGVGLFYYAGHGTQAYGENFLIPTDADIVDEADIRSAGISLQDVFTRMDRADNRLNVVILDACRIFPVKRSTRSGGNEGLTRVTAPSGTLIAYATAPNQVAKDGDGKNSPYTKNLVATINEHPGLKLEDVFKAVRTLVRTETGGHQEPWIESSIEGDFYFDPARRDGPTVVINVPAPPAGGAPANRTADGRWQKVGEALFSRAPTGFSEEEVERGLALNRRLDNLRSVFGSIEPDTGFAGVKVMSALQNAILQGQAMLAEKRLDDCAALIDETEGRYGTDAESVNAAARAAANAQPANRRLASMLFPRATGTPSESDVARATQINQRINSLLPMVLGNRDALAQVLQAKSLGEARRFDKAEQLLSTVEASVFR